MTLQNFTLGTFSQGAAGAAGAFESIATLTGNGSATQLTFSSIPSTFQHLQIRGIYKDTSTTDYAWNSNVCIRFTFNNNTTSANYANHFLYGNGSAAAAAGTTADGQIIARGAYMSSNATFANMVSAFTIDILDYASSSKAKTVRIVTGNDGNQASTNRTISLSSGLWTQTSAISSIEIYCGATAFASTTSIALYGIKGA